jgi:bacterial/archaeal transporter family protein
MKMWLWLALSSGIFHGLYDIFRKKALIDIPLLNVLAVYSFLSFCLVSLEFRNALQVNRTALLIIAIKSLIIFFSWILGFLALRSLPISIASPLDTLTPLFAILLGILVLNERLGFLQVIGVIIVLSAYYFMGKAGYKEIGGLLKNRFFYLMIGSTLLNAISSLIDKFVLKMVNIGQLQFWFCLFLTILYAFTYVFFKIRNHDRRPLQFSFAILGMSIFLVVADRLYFYAVNVAASQISIILPLRKISVLESSIGGGLLFKEKNLKAKFWCVCLMVVGIVILFVGK